MSSGCGDVLSLADLQTAKKHQIFEAEVITGKSGGVAGGADIDYATNAVTWQTQKTLPAVLRDAGFSPVSWDFATGGTLAVNDRDRVVYDPVSKTWYSYAGTLPVTVPAGFNPVGNANWKPQTDPNLRDDLSAPDGLRRIGQVSTIAVLRTIEPVSNGQKILVEQHTSSTGLGGGTFQAVIPGTSLTDNNGTVIKTASGAAWRRVNYKVATPRMFGALGDGITNDLSALNAALASEKVVDGEGLTYLVQSGAITVPSSRTFRNATITEPAVSNTTMLRVTGSNVTVSDVSFDGSTGTTSRGIIVNAGLSDVHIFKCKANDLKKPFVGVSGDYVNNLFCVRITIDKCFANNCGNDGTNYDRATVIFDGVSGCTVKDCYFSSCNWGISFRQPYDYPALTNPYAFYNKVEGCYLSGKAGYPYNQGISAQSQKHFSASGNTIEGFLGNAIDNQRCDFSRIENNKLTSGDDGVFFGDLNCKGHVVTGNVITGCVRGIRVYGAVGDWANQAMTDITITGNIITDSTVVGIYVYRTEPTNSFAGFNITGNIIDNSGTRGIASNTQGVLVTGLSGGVVSNNVIRNTRMEGLRFENSVGVVAVGNSVTGFDYSATAQAGIYLDVNSRGVQLRNSTISVSGGSGAAVREAGVNNTVTGTRWNGVTTGVNSTGTGAVLSDNSAY
mgnify:CR=1 FL=1